MGRKTLLWALLAVATLVLPGCNILEFTASDTDSNLTAKGQDDLRDGNFQSAIDNFTQALDKNPNNAEARWGRAKAYVRSTGFNTIQLMEELSTFTVNKSGQLPFMAWTLTDANTLFQAVAQASLDLRAIYDGEASSPELNFKTIGLDYSGNLTINALLDLRDTNRDTRITAEDVPIDVQIQNDQVLFQGGWDSIPTEDRQRLAGQVQLIMQTGGTVVKAVILQVLDNQGISVQDPNNLTDSERQTIKDSLGFDVANIDELVQTMVDALEAESH